MLAQLARSYVSIVGVPLQPAQRFERAHADSHVPGVGMQLLTQLLYAVRSGFQQLDDPGAPAGNDHRHHDETMRISIQYIQHYSIPPWMPSTRQIQPPTKAVTKRTSQPTSDAENRMKCVLRSVRRMTYRPPVASDREVFLTAIRIV